MRARSDRRRRPRQLEAREEERDLGARRRRRVGAVHRVLLDVGAELASDRALGRLLGIRRPHEIAPARDRGFPFELARIGRTSPPPPPPPPGSRRAPAPPPSYPRLPGGRTASPKGRFQRGPPPSQTKAVSGVSQARQPQPHRAA